MEEKTTKLCSNCKKEIEAKSIMLHEPFCTRNYKFCEDCNTIIEISEFDEHAKTHIKVSTSTSKPIIKPVRETYINPIVRNDEKIIPKNTNDDYINKQINCKFCDLPLLQSELKQHEINCGSRSEICEFCNKKFLVNQMKSHLESCTVRLALEQEEFVDYAPEDDLKLMQQKQIEEDERLARELMGSLNDFDNRMNINPNKDDEVARNMQMELDERLAKEIEDQGNQTGNQNVNQEEEMDESLRRILELSKHDK